VSIAIIKWDNSSWPKSSIYLPHIVFYILKMKRHKLSSLLNSMQVGQLSKMVALICPHILRIHGWKLEIFKNWKFQKMTIYIRKIQKKGILIHSKTWSSGIRLKTFTHKNICTKGAYIIVCTLWYRCCFWWLSFMWYTEISYICSKLLLDTYTIPVMYCL